MPAVGAPVRRKNKPDNKRSCSVQVVRFLRYGASVALGAEEPRQVYESVREMWAESAISESRPNAGVSCNETSDPP
jgi:hypothetical protein